MTFTILKNFPDAGEDMYYTSDFRNIIESHLNILKNIGVTKQNYGADLYYQYEGNFNGLLVELGIPPYLWWIYLRVNGMKNPNEFASDVRLDNEPVHAPVLIHPNDVIITNLRALYMSREF